MAQPRVDDSPEAEQEQREARDRDRREKKMFAIRLNLYMQRVSAYKQARESGEYPPEFIPVTVIGD